MTGRLRLLLVVVSVLLAALAVGLWLHAFDVTSTEVVTLLARLRWWVLVPLFACLAAHVALASWRWALLDEALGGSPVPFRQAFAFGTLGVALGTFLPPPLMNVASRSLSNRISGGSPMRGALSGSLDQGADFAVVILMAVPSTIALTSGDLAVFSVLALAASLVGLGVVLLLPHPVRVIPFVRNRLDGRLADRSLLLRLYGISLLRLVNLTVITLLVFVASCAGDVAAIVIGVPMITLAISLVMLPGALGVSEWSFSVVFERFDVAQQDIVLFVLANRLILTGLSLALAMVTMAASAMTIKALRPRSDR